MATNQKWTAQGVRDLNHTGPKIKPQPSAEAADAPTLPPATSDEAAPALASAAANDETLAGAAVDNG